MTQETSAREGFLTTWDGSRLFYRSWLPDGEPGRAVLLFHRGHEHSGRLAEVARSFAADGYAAFAWDARGNGRSPGRRDWAESFSVFVKDADAFARHVSREHEIPIEEIAVVAESLGALTAAAWVHEFAPRIRALVLAAPAFRIKLYVPLAVPALRLARALGAVDAVPSYVKGRVLTHDPDKAASFDADPLITHSISTDVLLDCHDTATRLLRDAGAIRVPTLLMSAGKDWVVKLKPQVRFFRSLSSAMKEHVHYRESFHAILHERDREAVLAKVKGFVAAAFAAPMRPPLTSADRSGYTRIEFDRLRSGTSNPWYAGQRMLLGTLGRLSAGIRIGWRSGFDSGTALDYVYENRPRGLTPLGRVIDRAYLNSIGWRGIRQRKLHLMNVLSSVVLDATPDRPVRVLDIAAGGGRYVLEVLSKCGNGAVSAVLRDSAEHNLDAGRAIAAELGVSHVVFERADAFDRASIASVRPRPNVGMVSGLYELFSDNERVLESLRGLAEALEPGGHLVYTNQPWHPQLEFVARVLTNRDGEPWIMRRRTQEEMDDLVREAGFEKVRMEIDRWGIFTVSLARLSR